MLVPCLSNFPEIHMATKLGFPVHMNMLTKKKKKGLSLLPILPTKVLALDLPFMKQGTKGALEKE